MTLFWEVTHTGGTVLASSTESLQRILVGGHPQTVGRVNLTAPHTTEAIKLRLHVSLGETIWRYNHQFIFAVGISSSRGMAF